MKKYFIALGLAILMTGCITGGGRVDPAFSYILNKRLTALENKTNTVTRFDLSGKDLELLLEYLKDQEEKRVSILDSRETKMYRVKLGLAELPVELIKTQNGWEGPRKELYKKLPSNAQIQAIYGR
jgi:hypothetical protein